MSFDDFGRHKNLQSFHIKVDHWSGIPNFYHLQGHLSFLATLSVVRVEIKYGNDNEENRNGVPVLTVVELPHAAKQSKQIVSLSLISSQPNPPAWKQNGQKYEKVACIVTCYKLVPKRVNVSWRSI